MSSQLDYDRRIITAKCYVEIDWKIELNWIPPTYDLKMLMHLTFLYGIVDVSMI